MPLRSLALTAALMGIAAAPLHAQGHPPVMKDKPLRPVSSCMDPTRIDQWRVIDNHTLIVRNGPRHYLITTRGACPKLGRYGASIRFHLSRSASITGQRICGDIGEMVSSRAQPPCAIDRVKPISKARFKALDQQAIRKGTRAGEVPYSAPHH